MKVVGSGSTGQTSVGNHLDTDKMVAEIIMGVKESFEFGSLKITHLVSRNSWPKSHSQTLVVEFR
jgi:hypothetical protein